MESKSLIIITPGFPKNEDDTACLPTQQLFVQTVHRLFPELQIKVISLHYPYFNIQYRWRGIDVYALNGNSRKGVFRILTWYKAWQLLKKIAWGSNKVFVLSFWSNETALIGNHFAKRNKLNHKIWISGQDARKENWHVKWIKPSPNDLVAMSAFLQNEFYKNHGIKPGHIISNAVLPTFSKTTKDIDIIGAGSLIPLKRYDIFIEAIAELKKQNPNVSAVLFGKGEEENNLKLLIKRHGLRENVQLTGEVDHATLMQWMNRAKVLLHPSSYEGYSTVCLEALANGCHVISFTHAENIPVKNWHVVKGKSEMIGKASELLNSELNFGPVLVRDMETTAKQMIALFEDSQS
jgi:glycosyltransferase involved in cell wall biosynthesis